MDEKQYQALVEKIGKEAADKIKNEMLAYEAKMTAMIAGKMTIEEFKAAEKSIQDSVLEVKDIAVKQGTSIQELIAKLSPSETGTKSISEQLKADSEELRKIYSQNQGFKTYIVNMNEKGQMVMKPFDATKAAGVTSASGGTPSISQAFDATTLLRLGGDAPIISLFRNNPYIFDLCNLINVGFNNPFFIWFDEQAVQGGSNTVAEAGTKPMAQYAYQLNSNSYKKEAVLVSFTDEFALDFEQLQSDIMSKVRIDLINNINTKILVNIKAAATAYNSAATFAPAGDLITNANDFDVLAALAAQVESNTFASNANTALVSTYKKWRMGILKDTQGRYLNVPDVLKQMGLVSNPGVTANDVIVGAFKNYNIALRGGIIVKIGFNGTDFANNQFSTVTEQYYFDYISTVRKPSIVKGPDFATVKGLITAP